MELVQDNPWIKNPLPYTVEDAVVKALEPTGEGYIELAKEHAQNCADMLGHLVQILHESGIINDEAVLKLLPGFKKYTGAPDDGH